MRGHEAELWFLYRKSHAYTGDGQPLLETRPRSFADFLRLSGLLLARLRERRPDALISYTPYANVIGQAAAWFTGVPVRVASQHNPPWSYSLLAREADRLLGSIGMYTANVMVSASTAASFGSYPRCYRQRTTVVRNGIDVLPGDVTRESARARLGVPESVTLLVNVGRLSYQKNQRLLLQVLAGLPNGVHLAMAGGGELRDELLSYAADVGVRNRAHFLGELDPTAVKHLLAAGDLFVFPSRHEGMSLALLEAMAAGLPAVVSDIPANVEVVQFEESGPVCRLVPSDDAESWRVAIVALLDDETERQRLRELGRRHATRFSVTDMVTAYEGLIARDDCMARPHEQHER